MTEILARLRADLRANADEKSIANYQRYFKETVKFYGLSMSAANKIAVKYWKEVKALSKPKFSLSAKIYSNRITVKKRRLPPTGLPD